MIQVECGCGAKMQAKDEKAGSSFDCPKCGKRLTVHQVAETLDELPVLKRRGSAEPEERSVNADSPVESRAISYTACRVMRVVLVISGILSFIAATWFGSLALPLVASNRVNLDAIVTLMFASVASTVYGFAGFALSELLGGVVSFLVKNDCRP